MARKRKLESKSAVTQSKKQQQIEEVQYYDQEEDVEEEEEEEVEEEEVEEEEDEDEEEEVEDEEEEEEQEEENDDDESAENQTTNATAEASASAEVEEEPFQKLLEPLGKHQLINLLCAAAGKHADVASSIRTVANADPALRKIFVHGLGWDTNAETLTAAFMQYGEIEDCKAVCDKVSGKSKGYGFILFKTRSGARNALKQPQKKIGNRMTSCQLASMGPVPQSPAAPATAVAAAAVPSVPASEYTQRKIYVSNVSAELEPQKLFAFFSKYGEIEEGPLGLDKQTGKPKGFCLFVYKTMESAKKALVEAHKNFEGHVLHCQKAIDGPKQNKLQSHYHPKARNPKFQRSENPGFVGLAAGTGHLMAPAAPVMQFNQGAAAQALNPALGQALTALLATQGLSNLLGTLGGTGVGAPVNPVVPGGGHGMQGAYGNQGAGSSVSSGVMAGYGNQVGYQNQQLGQGGSDRPQHGGVGHMGGIGPYQGQ